jgi:hypothetical protein
MSDTASNKFLAYGTNAQRLAFTPSPATLAAAPFQAYFWFATDTSLLWVYTTAWASVGGGSGGGSGDMLGANNLSDVASASTSRTNLGLGSAAIHSNSDYDAAGAAAAAQSASQPVDSDLTAIAALTTTSFGRALLALTNAAAMVAAVGTLPAGGTTGQVPTKLDGTDYNTTWATPSAGGGSFATLDNETLARVNLAILR